MAKMNYSNPSGQDGHFFRDENTFAKTSEYSLNVASPSAILRMLIEKGHVTHEEIANCERELQNHREAQNRSGAKNKITDVAEMDKNLVRTYSSREKKPVKFQLLRKILGKYKWGRKIGSALFGWKWRRKSPKVQIDISRQSR